MTSLPPYQDCEVVMVAAASVFKLACSLNLSSLFIGLYMYPYISACLFENKLFKNSFVF